MLEVTYIPRGIENVSVRSGSFVYPTLPLITAYVHTHTHHTQCICTHIHIHTNIPLEGVGFTESGSFLPLLDFRIPGNQRVYSPRECNWTASRGGTELLWAPRCASQPRLHPSARVPSGTSLPMVCKWHMGPRTPRTLF